MYLKEYILEDTEADRKRQRDYIERETEKPDSQGMERDRQKEVDLPYTERERKIDST